MTDVLSLISKTTDGVFAIDPEERIILWNRSAEEVLGFTADEVLGRYCYEVLGGRDSSGNLFCFQSCSIMTMARRGEPIRSYDVQWVSKEGGKVWFNVSIILVPSSKGKDPIILHLFRNANGPARTEALASQILTRVEASLKSDGGLLRRDEPPSPSKMSTLTPRETEILTLMAQCKGCKEIADRLGISGSTVRTHIQNILQKLQVHSKLEAVVLALQGNRIETHAR